MRLINWLAVEATETVKTNSIVDRDKSLKWTPGI